MSILGAISAVILGIRKLKQERPRYLLMVTQLVRSVAVVYLDFFKLRAQILEHYSQCF